MYTIEELEQECIRRYKEGDKIKRLDGYFYGDGNDIIQNPFWELENGRVIGETTNGYYVCLFKDGKWAELLNGNTTEGNDIHTDIQSLKDKYPQFNITVSVEDANTTNK